MIVAGVGWLGLLAAMRDTERIMAEIIDKPTIIAISSHVARGAVGNRAVVFALERLGFPVVAVPTVTLSWHPGDGPATRIVPPAESFAALLEDLSGAPWLDRVGAVLSGYLGDAAQARPIAALVDAITARNPDVLYLCDPVIGDQAGPYVVPEIIAAIGGNLLSIADIITPNRHELGILLDQNPADNDGLVGAARAIGIREAVITSAFASVGEIANLLVTRNEVYRAAHTASAVAPHGTGDLLAALYLAHRLDGTGGPEALRMAAGSTRRLIKLASGAGELPLAGGQSELFASDDAVSLTRIA